ncbi:MAG: pyruvate synthase subunit beta [Chloroflexi bacterium]|nr:pyruvate synthase subunit beta [Chloroflexota bacterium]
MTQEFVKFGKREITTDEPFASGHRGCIGCGEALAVRLAMKALGRDVAIANATGCIEIISSPLPDTSWEVPWIHTLFENTAAVASGIESGYKMLMKKGRIPQKHIDVIAIAGDGATADIGIQALSGALERGHDFVYLCFDNEAYMNTGIQRSSSTPYGASTTTAPAGKVITVGQQTQKKNMPAIAVAHNIPYVATASPSYPFDLMEKVKKAADVKGPAYVHILSVCDTGWRIPTNMSVTIGRMAVQTGMFPLYEVENGKYKLNVDKELKPVEEYLKKQGRYRHLSDDEIQKIQEHVTQEYAKLKQLATS